MTNFVRMTKITNLGGRANYISNTEVQEEIVAVSAAVDWKPYRDYEQLNSHANQKNNEGRELIIALPNEWGKLPTSELSDRIGKLADIAVGGFEYQWAAHWNKSRTNLHAHIIFSERKRTSEEKRYDRDIYLTADGKVARRRADRAKDADGNTLPPAHRKGEVQKTVGFSAKDTKFKSKAWLQSCKQAVADAITRMGGVIEQPDYLHQYHEGKGSQAPKIRTKNAKIKQINAEIRRLRRLGYKFPRRNTSAYKQLCNNILSGSPVDLMDYVAPYFVEVTDRQLDIVRQSGIRFKSVPNSDGGYTVKVAEKDKNRLLYLLNRGLNR